MIIQFGFIVRQIDSYNKQESVWSKKEVKSFWIKEGISVAIVVVKLLECTKVLGKWLVK